MLQNQPTSRMKQPMFKNKAWDQWYSRKIIWGISENKIIPGLASPDKGKCISIMYLHSLETQFFCSLLDESIVMPVILYSIYGLATPGSKFKTNASCT